MLLGLAAAAVTAEVGVTDGPKGVVVNSRNGKAYAAFPDLGLVKIVEGIKWALRLVDADVTPRAAPR
jgi:hypothetical protein